MMRAVVWIEEGSWVACVDRARGLLEADADVTLLYVCSAEVEEVALHPGGPRLGRHRIPPGPPVRSISDGEAQALLECARERLGRPAELVVRHGRVEHEVLEVADGADVLLLARDGELEVGPASLGRRSRFVVDHAACDVLVIRSEPPLRRSAAGPRP
jgi:nucleotide-binding universal stress UspA family protein